jgi:hypothetical protein
MPNKNLLAGWWLVAAAMAFCPIAGAALKTLPGHMPAVVPRLHPTGRLAATNRLDLAIGLPLRNQPALKLFLHELGNPASANFHRYLTPGQFTAQFGPTEPDYQTVVDFARSSGLTVTHTHGNRVLLDVNGKVSDIEKAFHITLRTYRHPTEPRNFFAPDSEPSVETGMPILDISGLSDYAKPKPMLHRRPVTFSGGPQPAAGSGPGNGYIGTDFRNAYVPGTTLNGFGQMVGLFQLTGYDPNDIFAYEAQAGLPDVPLQNVLIDGYDGWPRNGEDEACLDIEMTISMATNLAAVVVFEAPDSAAYWSDALNTMAASNQIQQFSSSWGFSGGPSQTLDQIFEQMGAQGQSFFQASGDGDAWTNPIWEPAESPYVTVVGGTTLFMNGSGGSYLSEEVWNSGYLGTPWGPNGDGYWGSGGGVSGNYAIPDWQTNVDMTTNLGSTTMRNIPDVAMTADNVYVAYGSGTNGIYGGTSCAAPLWAGFMALVNQQAAGMDNPAAGFLNPAIYALGNSTNYTACFNDITTGNNTSSDSPNLYYAVPGYDLCTGWGTPAGANLINALAGAPDPLAITPLGGFVANGVAGGPFTGTLQVFTLNNAGTGLLSWSLINTSAWFTISASSGTLSAGCETNVAVCLASAANALTAGSYTAVIFFTNQTTGVAQPRFFTLQVGQSLVQDGGFESGTFCWWTLVGNTIINTTNGPVIYNAVENPADGWDVAYSGNYGAFLGDTNVATLSQMLPTCPGQEYLLSFWLNNPIGGSNELFEVNWNTNGMTTNTICFLPNPPGFAWTNLNFVLTAAGTNTMLQFGAENQPNYFGLDDISVTAVPAPVFSAVTAAGNGVAVTWTTLAGVAYLVQYKTDLLQTNWLDLGGSITADSDTLTQTDTNAFDASPQRFYRVSVSP